MRPSWRTARPPSAPGITTSIDDSLDVVQRSAFEALAAAPLGLFRGLQAVLGRTFAIGGGPSLGSLTNFAAFPTWENPHQAGQAFVVQPGVVR